MPAFSVHGAPRRGLTGQIVGDKGKLKFRNELVYRVKLVSGNAADATYWDAASATGLPLVNLTPYRIGTKWIPYSICKAKKAKQVKGNIEYWDVTCTFESPTLEGNEGDSTNQPQDRPASLPDVAPVIEYKSETTERVAWNDINDKPILNPLGEHFAEPTMKPVTLVVATLTFYTADSVSWDKIAEHGGKVNDNAWNGKPRYSWLTFDITRSPAKIPLDDDTEVDALQWTYVFKHNPLPEGWRSSKILISTHYLEDAPATAGEPTQNELGDAKEFKFKTSGNRRTGFITETGVKSDAPVYKNFEHIEELDFSSEIGDP